SPVPATKDQATAGWRKGWLAVRFRIVIQAKEAHRKTSTPADRIRRVRSGSEPTTVSWCHDGPSEREGGPDGPPPRFGRTSYFVVPVPLMSNGAAASDCSELPSSRRKRAGVVWSLPPKNVDRPVIEYMPAPDLIPRPVADVVSVIVQANGADGGGFETGTHGLAVADCVRWY